MTRCKTPQILASIANKRGNHHCQSSEFTEEKKKMIPKQTRKEVRKIKGVGGMRNWLHHNLNSLHIYCRLVRFMPRWFATKIVLHWEKTAIYSVIYNGI